jgi:antigen flippase
VALIGLAVAGRFRPVAGALAYVLPTLPFFLWNAWWVYREFRPRLAGFWRHSRELLSYGLRVHIVDAGNALFGQLDKVILVALLAPAAFGVYVVVFNLSRLVTTFATSAIPVLLPRTAGRPLHEVLALTSRALSATTILTAVAVAGFALLGALVLRLLYGAQFSAGYWTLVVLAVEAACASGAAILQQPYMVLNRPGAIAVFHTTSLGVAGLLMYVLAGRFGAEGAACGLLAGTSLRLALTFGGFRWLLGVAAPRIIPSRDDWDSLVGRARAALA